MKSKIKAQAGEIAQKIADVIIDETTSKKDFPLKMKEINKSRKYFAQDQVHLLQIDTFERINFKRIVY